VREEGCDAPTAQYATNFLAMYFGIFHRIFDRGACESS
jgi:hypothetical protein